MIEKKQIETIKLKSGEEDLSSSYISKYFSQFIKKKEKSENQKEIMYLTALLLSDVLQAGDIYIDINDFAEKKYNFFYQDYSGSKQFPNKKKWISVLKKSKLVSDDDSIDSVHYFKLKNDRVYLYKYWLYEKKTALYVNQNLNSQKEKNINYFTEQEINQDIFDNVFLESEDEKKVAAYKIIKNNFAILSGGPGTGKTYTMVNILLYFIKKNILENKKIKIALAAPTGKAANRMEESLLKRLQEIQLNDEEKKLLPQQALTLHRLLQYQMFSGKPKYNQNNKLIYDILIVDEASMIDIVMMNNLMDALSFHTKLILLGDKNQLSSVEAGKVFGELSFVNLEKNQYVATLYKSRRFDDKSGIGQLIKSIQLGDIEKVIETMRISADINWISTLNTKESLSQILDQIKEISYEGFHNFLKTKNINEAIDSLENFCVLCATRKGSLGVENIRFELEEKFSSYSNRMRMITKNDYQNNLFNGDILVSLDDIIYYQKNKSNELKAISKILLPQHESAFAITVHKSQGSEYDTVFCIFPEEIHLPILSRELFYTAVSRAKSKLIILAKEDVVRKMVLSPVERKSGLSELISI